VCAVSLRNLGQLIRVVDSRVWDLTVYNIFGHVLCKIQGLEMRLFSLKSYTINTRYDIQAQPVLTSQPFPRCVAGWDRDDIKDFLMIHTVLDNMAMEIFKKSLKEGVIVGDEVWIADKAGDFYSLFFLLVEQTKVFRVC
jgi:hypothetical protein